MLVGIHFLGVDRPTSFVLFGLIVLCMMWTFAEEYRKIIFADMLDKHQNQIDELKRELESMKQDRDRDTK